jgi:hypothetical protein
MASTATQRQPESSAATDSRNLRATLESAAAQLDDMRYTFGLITCLIQGTAPPAPPVPFSVPNGMTAGRLAGSINTLSAELAGQVRSIYGPLWSSLVRRTSAPVTP